MKRLLAVLAILLGALSGCTGTGVGASCTRNPDGTVTCTVEVHRHEGGKP